MTDRLIAQIETYLPITDHTWIFFVVLCMILIAPLVFEKLRIPNLIGMVIAGMIVGEHGFNVLARDAGFELFGQVGLYYIMFNAGLSMDLGSVKKNLSASLTFTALTFCIPFGFGYLLLHYYLGYHTATALLLSVIFGCHTLLAFPIVSRYGLTRHKSVTIAIGGTLLSLLAALIVLASVVAAYSPEAHSYGALWVLVKCIGLFVGAFLLLPPLIRYFFRRTPDNVLQYIFVLSVVFLCAALADLLALEGILGAFLAGIIMGRYIPTTSPLMNRIEFVGNALFIPYFLIGVGMLINIRLLFEDTDIIGTVIIIVAFATLSKAAAAFLTQWLFRLGRHTGLMMFGLTNPHAAGALAMVLVGLRTEVAPGVMMADEQVFNVFVMLLLFSCLISTLATEAAARRMAEETEVSEPRAEAKDRIMIALANEEAVEPLVTTALMMRRKGSTEPLIAMNVLLESEDVRAAQAGQKILDSARRIALGADVEMLTQRRISVNVSTGIIHFTKEAEASDLLLGLHRRANYSDKFYGTIMQDILRNLVRQILILRILQPVNTLRRIHVLVPQKAEYEVGFGHWLDTLARLAQQTDCRLVFYVSDRTKQPLSAYLTRHHKDVRTAYEPAVRWNNLIGIAAQVMNDHLLVIVQARRGTISYHNTFESVPGQLERYFSGKNFLLIYPNQYGED